MNARSNTFCVIGLVVSFCFTGLLAFQGRPLSTLRTIDERCLAMVYGGQVGPCYQCKISSECSTKNNLDCVWKDSFNGNCLAPQLRNRRSRSASVLLS
jgi:hypothetical protein